MNIRNSITNITLLLAIATSCGKETICVKYKEDIKDLSPSGVTVLSSMTSGDTVTIEMEEGHSVTDQLYVCTNRTSAFDTYITLSFSEKDALSYIASHPSVPERVTDSDGRVEITTIGKTVLPKSFCNFQDGATIILDAGMNRSEAKTVQIATVDRFGHKLTPGRYVLALKAENGSMEEILYYDIYVPVPRICQEYKLYTGTDNFTVCYINTADYDPRIITDYVFEKTYQHGDIDDNKADGNWTETLWKASIGNIVNLRKSSIEYDMDSGRAILKLSSDLAYVLEHPDKYIRPLQESGRKVCITLEGGNTGLGFCNLTDAQAEDLAMQVKSILRLYGLDGINLWDRSSGYEKAADRNLPAPGTTSYPKFIKKLREAIGWRPLLTLADQGVPTESFHDTGLSGGIAAGEYLDYAWAANVTMKNLPVVDPYNQGGPGVSSEYPRLPIAGLAQERYGCIFFTLYTEDINALIWDECTSQYIKAWVESGLRNNNMVVFNDISTNVQNLTEFSIEANSLAFQYLCNDERITYSFDKHQLYTTGAGQTGYNEWLKDW
ncbi:MAG: hypothetical protein NC115_00660 [Bacteroidales bacterium]|nr:hypothetical protein [Bacteroidales bacterium]